MWGGVSCLDWQAGLSHVGVGWDCERYMLVVWNVDVLDGPNWKVQSWRSSGFVMAPFYSVVVVVVVVGEGVGVEGFVGRRFSIPIASSL